MRFFGLYFTVFSVLKIHKRDWKIEMTLKIEIMTLKIEIFTSKPDYDVKNWRQINKSNPYFDAMNKLWRRKPKFDVEIKNKTLILTSWINYEVKNRKFVAKIKNETHILTSWINYDVKKTKIWRQSKKRNPYFDVKYKLWRHKLKIKSYLVVNSKIKCKTLSLKLNTMGW